MNKFLNMTVLALIALHHEVHAARADVSESWLSKTVRRLLHGETPAPESAGSAPVGDVDRRRIADAADGCADRNTYCPYWANSGECDVNPKFMMVYCKVSCGACAGSWSITEGTKTVNRDEDIKEREIVKETTNQQWANGGTGVAGTIGAQVGWNTEQGQRLTEAERETLAREQRNTQSKTHFGDVTGINNIGTGNFAVTTGTETLNRQEDIQERTREQERLREQWANGGVTVGAVDGQPLTMVGGQPLSMVGGMWFKANGERITEAERETLAREQRNTRATTHFGDVKGFNTWGAAGTAGSGDFAVTTGTENVERQEDIKERQREQEILREQWANGNVGVAGAAGLPLTTNGGIQWVNANGERLTEAERETLAREQRNTRATTHFGGVTGGKFLGTPLVAGALNGFPIARPAGTTRAVTTGTKTVQRDVDITEAQRVKEMLLEQWAQGQVNGQNGIGTTMSHGTRTTEREREMNAHTKEQTQSKTDFVKTSGFASMAHDAAGGFAPRKATPEVLGFGAWIVGPYKEPIWVEGQEAVVALGL